MGGSALGAKRHGGFIPWDDDLDIFMTVENYEKFRSLFKQYGDKERFYLQEWGLQNNGQVTIPKLRMNDTTYMEQYTKDWDIHQGIFVDIFILHKCPMNRIKRIWQCFWAKCVVVKGMSLRGYDRQTGFKKILLSVSKILPKRVMVSYGLKQVYKYNNDNTNLYCNFLGKAVFKKGIYPAKWFFKTVKVPFEKVELSVPIGLEDFLTARFGDYMKIPSPERIKWEQHAYKWSTTKSFEENMSKIVTHNFTDECKLV